jgi:NADH-quinone oxidoreductase subunit L
MNSFSTIDSLTTALVALPLLGFLINGLMGQRLSKSMVGAIGSGVVLGAFLLSCGLMSMHLSGAFESHTTNLFAWLPIGDYTAKFALLVDPLSLLMLMVVTGVGSLIHIYSIGYMHEDEGFYKFFAYLNLFIFSMLLLVLGANFPMLFAGWEGVGLCSYLLIGFWYKNADYTAAAQKAFVMNRIGDLGFLLGIFLVFSTFGTLDFTDVMNAALQLGTDSPVAVGITLLLFVGAMGKSAQLPLFTWLPDAMAGPTPVSALIHAATMVTAGLYMIARCNVLYALAPTTLHFITLIAIATALLAATIAVFQNDIKKVLAYSTVSQLGYMFAAMGMGAFATGMFHVMTHAFFKALLFLGAGAVIHALHGEQNIGQMGGLKNRIPFTYKIFLVGTLAVAGLPPLSGFFSKDEILATVFAHNPILWVLLLLGSLLTAFYMLRLLWLVFYGEYRGNHHVVEHLHDNPNTMNYPLVVLAVLSVVGGFVGMPAFLHLGNAFHEFLEPVFASSAALLPHQHLHATTEIALMALTVALVGTLIYLALFTDRLSGIFLRSLHTEGKNTAWWKKLWSKKYYVDEIYDTLFVSPSRMVSRALHQVDTQLVDGTVNGLGHLTALFSQMSVATQIGKIGGYMLLMSLGVLGLLLVFVLG